jgi:hypothetical protein
MSQLRPGAGEERVPNRRKDTLPLNSIDEFLAFLRRIKHYDELEKVLQSPELNQTKRSQFISEATAKGLNFRKEITALQKPLAGKRYKSQITSVKQVYLPHGKNIPALTCGTQTDAFDNLITELKILAAIADISFKWNEDELTTLKLEIVELTYDRLRKSLLEAKMNLHTELISTYLAALKKLAQYMEFEFSDDPELAVYAQKFYQKNSLVQN